MKRKKQWLLLACCLLLALVLVGCHLSQGEGDVPSSLNDGENEDDPVLKKTYQLIVLDQNVPIEHLAVSMYSDYVELPILTILDAMGASVTWDGDKAVQIEYGGKQYRLDVSQGLMYHQDKVFVDFNVASPGTVIRHSYECPVIPDEYVAPDHCADFFANKFGIRIHVDYSAATVRVRSR
jgi:hypothetical protein